MPPDNFNARRALLGSPPKSEGKYNDDNNREAELCSNATDRGAPGRTRH